MAALPQNPQLGLVEHVVIDLEIVNDTVRLWARGRLSSRALRSFACAITSAIIQMVYKQYVPLLWSVARALTLECMFEKAVLHKHSGVWALQPPQPFFS